MGWCAIRKEPNNQTYDSMRGNADEIELFLAPLNCSGKRTRNKFNVSDTRLALLIMNVLKTCNHIGQRRVIKTIYIVVLVWIFNWYSFSEFEVKLGRLKNTLVERGILIRLFDRLMIIFPRNSDEININWVATNNFRFSYI